MTQFQPPPVPPAQPPYPGGRQAPMSAAAVGGFVCSFLGCLGIPALLGLLFGIIGVVKTANGVRRGRGLAIAAIPISVVTGAGSVLFGFMAVLGFSLATIMANLGIALADAKSDPSGAIEVLHRVSTEDFASAVDATALVNWVDRLKAVHGGFVELEENTMPPQQAGGKMVINLTGRFVNGPANIRIELATSGPFKLLIHDIEIDGLSPRDMGG